MGGKKRGKTSLADTATQLHETGKRTEETSLQFFIYEEIQKHCSRCMFCPLLSGPPPLPRSLLKTDPLFVFIGASFLNIIFSSLFPHASRRLSTKYLLRTVSQSSPTSPHFSLRLPPSGLVVRADTMLQVMNRGDKGREEEDDEGSHPISKTRGHRRLSFSRSLQTKGDKLMGNPSSLPSQRLQERHANAQNDDRLTF